jgi:predicted nucleic acid-binding protein
VRAHYFDTSALVKLVVPGEHSNALKRWWSRQPGVALSSQIARTELVRGARRIDPDALGEARSLLADVSLIGVTTEILDSAGRLDPVSLGSLDAIHLASALDLGGDLEGFVTYDERLAAAARGYGIVVVQPR